MRGPLRFWVSGTALAVILTAAGALAWPAAAQDAATAEPTSLLATPSSAVPAAPAAAPAAPASAPGGAPASVTAGLTVRVRAGAHPDFDRIVFDWPRPIAYSLSRAGTTVTLQFAAPALVKTGGLSLLSRLRDFRAGIDANGNLAASFTVPAPATVKDFMSDTSLVVDVTGRAAASATRPAAAVVAPAAPPRVSQKPVKPPVAVAAAPPAQPPPAKKAGPPPAPEPAPVAPVTTAAAIAPFLPPAAAPAAAPPAAAAASDDPGPALGSTPLLIAALDPHAPMRAVVWQRAGIGAIVFDRKLTLNLAALTQGQEAPKLALMPFDLPKATGYRFNMPDHAELRATNDGTVWKLYLARQQPDLPVSTALVPQPDFALGARFILPLTNPPEPIRFTDPVVGDELVLVPLEQDEAFSLPRQLADFLILPAAQGLVIKPLIDRLTVRPVSDGIEITAEGGLHLSSTVDTGAIEQSPQKARAQAAGKSLFDITAWRGKPNESFTQARQRLQQTVVDVPDRERIRARMELARFYFARGYGEEASGLLALLAQQAPDLKAHADFLSLSGAARIMAHRPQEGLQDLNDSGLTSQPEIELWQAAGFAEARRWGEAQDRFAASESELAGYPEPFYSRFSVLAVEAAFATAKNDEGARWLKRLANGPHSEAAQPAIDYLSGVMAAQAGKAPAAENDWRTVETSHDRLYKVRAELALIDLGVANGSLTAAQAADRLEALRFGWRGDDLEVDILHRLGQFYVTAHNFKQGLAVLASAIRLYPDSALTPDIRTEMAQTFHDIFLTDLGKNLSPLDALTLYQQYRNLTPTGADGAAVTRNLAERLVAIDLLAQAGDLLDELVKTQLQGEDKARTGSRLAAIRLLDHQPDAALAALDASAVPGMTAVEQNDRQLLRAKALADSGKPDDALVLVKDNTTQPAKVLRADVLMKAQRWPEAALALVALAGPPPKAGEALSLGQADALVNAAIAYSLAGDQTGLDKLAIDYETAMNATPQADTFRILTQPEKTAQLRDVSAVQARIADVDMFQSFLNTYRKADSPAPAPAKAAGK